MNAVQPIRDPEQIERIKEFLWARSARDYLLFCTGIYTGLRISDVRRIRVETLRSASHIVLRERKTGKEQRILINTELRRAARKALEGREGDEYCFKSQKGENQPIGRRRAYEIVKQACKACGAPGNVGTHTMRKTFGYHYYRRTKDVAFLMDLFNHSSEKITLRYIGVDQDKRDKALRDFRYG